jgi:hypothetical protein
MLARPYQPHPHPIGKTSRITGSKNGATGVSPVPSAARLSPAATANLDARFRNCLDQVLQRRPQFAETERIPAAPEFARIHSLAGQQ